MVFNNKLERCLICKANRIKGLDYKSNPTIFMEKAVKLFDEVIINFFDGNISHQVLTEIIDLFLVEYQQILEEILNEEMLEKRLSSDQSKNQFNNILLN